MTLQRISTSTLAVAILVLSAFVPGHPITAQTRGEPGLQRVDTTPTFRSGIELVALTVTVEKPDGSYVSSLSHHDFRVFEQGVQQQVDFFGAGEVPIDLVLMIDTSASMTGRLDVAQRAALNFIRAVGPSGRVAVMAFGSRAEFLVPFTADRPALERAILALTPGGPTVLYNALYIAMKEFGTTQTEADFRRRAIVVLSDGEDTKSVVSFDTVIDEARRVGVAVYVIALRPESSRRQRQADTAVFEMRKLARETGALFFQPAVIEELDGVYGTIARELAHQYALGYVPADPDRATRFRRVAVLVDSPGARVRTRSGYIAGG